VALVGGGDPLASTDRRTFADEALKAQILTFVTDNPGLSQNKVMQGLGIKSQSTAGPVFSALKAERKVHTILGPNRAQLHYPGPPPDDADGDDEASAAGEIEP
jgi:hypothetical protein